MRLKPVQYIIKIFCFIVIDDIVEAGLNSRDVCILCKENEELTREKDLDRLSVETGYTESSDESFSSSSVTRYDIENEDTTKKSKPPRMDTAQHDIPVLGLSDLILKQTKIEEERFKREFNVSKDQHDLAFTNYIEIDKLRLLI